MKQKFFNYSLKPQLNIENYFISKSNENTFNMLMNNDNNYIFLCGPKKSGKTHLGLIWKEKFHAITYNNNVQNIIENKNNIFIDDVFDNIIEEDIFHVINHCHQNNLKILLTSRVYINEYNFSIKDLSSRLKTFINLTINFPDDELLTNLMIKLFNDKQIIINNPEILNYILKRAQRSYDKIFLLVEKIDQLSLEKNKELTIPLIKDLI